MQRVEQFLYAEYPVVSVPLMCLYEDADIVLGVWVLIGLLIRLHVELQRILLSLWSYVTVICMQRHIYATFAKLSPPKILYCLPDVLDLPLLT